MKIGYLTKEDPENRIAYSGIHFKMYESLQKHFEEVIPLGPVDSSYKVVPKIKGRLYKALTKKIYKYQYNVPLAKRMAGMIDKKISKVQPDVLVASLMSPEVSYLNSSVPLYLTTDATFPLLKDAYQSHSNLHPKSIQEAFQLEERALQKARKLILPLQWLADSAMKHYGISADRIEVLPYGSNLDINLKLNEVDSLINGRIQQRTIKLLFVGVRWEEKGGPFVVEVLKELLNHNLSAELYVVGCEPEIRNKPKEVKILGFLDKENLQDAEKLHQLYKEASFFILPTKAECVGMSFIEAASVGLPAIGSKVGGVPEAIQHERTGFICDDVHSPKDVADWIIQVFADKSNYEAISREAFLYQQKNMNWDRWGKEVRKIINHDFS